MRENDIITEIKKKYVQEYEQAIFQEQGIRELVFLDAKPEICGLECEWFTPIHYMRLEGNKCPFVGAYAGERKPTIKDCIDFLWTVSPQFKSKNEEARVLFQESIIHIFSDPLLVTTMTAEEILELCLYKVCREINDYITDQYCDFPFKPEPKQPERQEGFIKLPGYCEFVSVVNLIAGAYGWTEEYIKTLPYIKINQYYKCIMDDRLALLGKSSPVYNRRTSEIQQKIQREISARIIEEQKK